MLSMLMKNTADNIFLIFSFGDNLHGMSNLFSSKNKKNILKCCMAKIYT